MCIRDRSSSSDWEEIPSGAQSDSPSGSRRRGSKRRPGGTNNASDTLLDSRDDSPINSQLRASKGVVPSLSTATTTQHSNPPRNESFTMIDTPRGPRDRNLQAHSVTLPPAVVTGSDESPSPSPDQHQQSDSSSNPRPIINVTASRSSSNPGTGLPPRAPLHPPSPMTKKQQPTVTILDGVMDASTPQQTTPLSLDLQQQQRSPGIINSAFPRIPPPRNGSQGSVNNPLLMNPNNHNNNNQQHQPHQYHNKPLGLFPSAASMDSLVGGPQSLHFSPNTPQQQGQWKDVSEGVGGGGYGGPTPGSSMSADCTPYRSYQGGGGGELGTGMGSRHESSNWGDAPSQSCESATRDTTTTNENSTVRNHQASLFSSVLAGFDERSRERSNSPSPPAADDAAKNGEPEGSAHQQAGAAPQANEDEEDEPIEGLTNQPTSEFREASADRSAHKQQHPTNQASEARARAAEESRKATVESLTSPPPATTVVDQVTPVRGTPGGIAVVGTVTPPAALRQHRWRPYLLRVYRWQTPRHSLVAVAFVVSFTTIVLPAIFVGIGPFRFILFGFAFMQLLSGALLVLAGVPQLRPLFVRCGVLEPSYHTSSTTTTSSTVSSSSAESSRKQARNFIAKTIKTRASALYDQTNLHDAIPQFGGYLWDKILELADPTEAVQGEHEAAVKLIHSDRKRRQSLQQPTPNKYLDPFANVQQDEAVQENNDEEEDEAMQALLQQSAYFDSAAISAAASSSSSSQEDEQKKKIAAMEGLVQEALRTERHALGKKLFLMLAAAIVVIEPVLDWAVNDASSPTSMFLFLLGVFICGRYPVRRILRREYIRRYGVTAGPFIQRNTTTTTTTPSSSPQVTKPVATTADDWKDATATSANNSNDEDDDVLQHTFMDTVTASVRSFVIGPLEDEVEDSEVFSGRPSEEFHHNSPSPPSTPNTRTNTPAASPKPDDVLKQTMRDINRRRTMSAMNPPSPRLVSSTAPTTTNNNMVEAAVPVTIKWVVADACLLLMMGLVWSAWKLLARTVLVG
eukprot:TRINITY_DN12421_c0_g2_i13.p1 TRINITY_DN12421_c0_g2~~TRINITY_DN12421_c0_g2_i13.p1  ORF type:complete len:1025 (+),score=197.92 TRINITY_DN12421_c0_g2_i13:172-3246(+)